jgi:hypothetical protein
MESQTPHVDALADRLRSITCQTPNSNGQYLGPRLVGNMFELEFILNGQDPDRPTWGSLTITGDGIMADGNAHMGREAGFEIDLTTLKELSDLFSDAAALFRQLGISKGA